MSGLTFIAPPGADIPAPPGARVPGPWGAAEPLQPIREPVAIFGPPITSLPRELLSGGPVPPPSPPPFTFVPFPKYDPKEHVKGLDSYVKEFTQNADGLNPMSVMLYAMTQYLQEAYKLQFEEHSGRLKNGAAVNLAVAARLAKEIEMIKKTAKVDVNLKGGQGSHEELLRNILSIPALNPE